MKRIAILTSGGDCPGINATIRGIGKTAIVGEGMEVLGIHKGFSGILAGEYEVLDLSRLSGILHLGGTILGTAREKSLRERLEEGGDDLELFRHHFCSMGVDCIVAIGGNGTQKSAALISELGFPVIGIPKTIDNDVWGTEVTFGFDTAVSIATEAIDRLHSTAESHNRVMVVEVMGHHAGWIALHAGMAGGADVILLPELGYDLGEIERALRRREKAGKKHSIVVVAEGLRIEDKSRPAHRLCKLLSRNLQIDSRETVLGYVQRGGGPTAADRNLCTRIGGYATELIRSGVFGVMVAIRDGLVSHIPLRQTAGKLRTVPRDHDLLRQGLRMGISFGVDASTLL